MTLTNHFNQFDYSQKNIIKKNYQQLYNYKPIYSHIPEADYPNPRDNSYDHPDIKEKWCNSKFYTQATHIVKEIDKIIPGFAAALNKYFNKPVMEGLKRTAIDSIKIKLEEIYFILIDLKKDNFNPNNAINLFKNLEFNCEPGCLTNLDFLYDSLTSDTTKLIHNAKSKLIYQIALEFIHEVFGKVYDSTLEIHFVNKLFNIIAKDYGLTPKNFDYYANENLFNSEDLIDFQEDLFTDFLKEELTKTIAIDNLLEIIAQDIFNSLPELDQGKILSYEEIAEVVKNIEIILNNIGIFARSNFLIDQENSDYDSGIIIYSSEIYKYLKIFLVEFLSSKNFLDNYVYEIQNDQVKYIYLDNIWYEYQISSSSFREYIDLNKLNFLHIGQKPLSNYIGKEFFTEGDKLIQHLSEYHQICIPKDQQQDKFISLLYFSNQAQNLINNGYKFEDIPDLKWLTFLYFYQDSLNSNLNILDQLDPNFLASLDINTIRYITDRHPDLLDFLLDNISQVLVNLDLRIISNYLPYIKHIEQLQKILAEAIENCKITDTNNIGFDLFFYITDPELQKKIFLLINQETQNSLIRNLLKDYNTLKYFHQPALLFFKELEKTNIFKNFFEKNLDDFVTPTFQPDYYNLLVKVFKFPDLFFLYFFKYVKFHELSNLTIKQIKVIIDEIKKDQELVTLLAKYLTTNILSSIVIKIDGLYTTELTLLSNHGANFNSESRIELKWLDFINLSGMVEQVISNLKTYPQYNSFQILVRQKLDQAINSQDLYSFHKLINFLEYNEENEQFLDKIFILESNLVIFHQIIQIINTTPFQNTAITKYNEFLNLAIDNKTFILIFFSPLVPFILDSKNHKFFYNFIKLKLFELVDPKRDFELEKFVIFLQFLDSNEFDTKKVLTEIVSSNEFFDQLLNSSDQVVINLLILLEETQQLEILIENKITDKEILTHLLETQTVNINLIDFLLQDDFKIYLEFLFDGIIYNQFSARLQFVLFKMIHICDADNLFFKLLAEKEKIPLFANQINFETLLNQLVEKNQIDLLISFHSNNSIKYIFKEVALNKFLSNSDLQSLLAKLLLEPKVLNNQRIKLILKKNFSDSINYKKNPELLKFLSELENGSEFLKKLISFSISKKLFAFTHDLLEETSNNIVINFADDKLVNIIGKILQNDRNQKNIFDIITIIKLLRLEESFYNNSLLNEIDYKDLISSNLISALRESVLNQNLEIIEKIIQLVLEYNLGDQNFLRKVIAIYQQKITENEYAKIENRTELFKLIIKLKLDQLYFAIKIDEITDIISKKSELYIKKYIEILNYSQHFVEYSEIIFDKIFVNHEKVVYFLALTKNFSEEIYFKLFENLFKKYLYHISSPKKYYNLFSGDELFFSRFQEIIIEHNEDISLLADFKQLVIKQPELISDEVFIKIFNFNYKHAILIHNLTGKILSTDFLNGNGQLQKNFVKEISRIVCNFKSHKEVEFNQVLKFFVTCKLQNFILNHAPKLLISANQKFAPLLAEKLIDFSNDNLELFLQLLESAFESKLKFDNFYNYLPKFLVNQKNSEIFPALIASKLISQDLNQKESFLKQLLSKPQERDLLYKYLFSNSEFFYQPERTLETFINLEIFNKNTLILLLENSISEQQQIKNFFTLKIESNLHKLYLNQVKKLIFKLTELENQTPIIEFSGYSNFKKLDSPTYSSITYTESSIPDKLSSNLLIDNSNHFDQQNYDNEFNNFFNPPENIILDENNPHNSFLQMLYLLKNIVKNNYSLKYIEDKIFKSFGINIIKPLKIFSHPLSNSIILVTVNLVAGKILFQKMNYQDMADKNLFLRKISYSMAKEFIAHAAMQLSGYLFENDIAKTIKQCNELPVDCENSINNNKFYSAISVFLYNFIPNLFPEYNFYYSLTPLSASILSSGFRAMQTLKSYEKIKEEFYKVSNVDKPNEYIISGIDFILVISLTKNYINNLNTNNFVNINNVFIYLNIGVFLDSNFRAISDSWYKTYNQESNYDNENLNLAGQTDNYEEFS